jgi:fructokinase
VKPQVCIFGEVLFDHFPEGQSVLGGAPFNVAWHLQAFGLAPLFISQVGQDEQGQKIIQAMRQWQMNENGLARSDDQTTGRVDIRIVDNEPQYDIVSPSAWDFIPVAATTSACQVIYHGSLAMRHQHNRDSFNDLMSNSKHRIFLDVNLRNPWWQLDEVLQMIARCDWLKLNIDEFNLLFPSSRSLVQRIEKVVKENQLQAVILTRGSEGAMLMTCDGNRYSVEPENSIDIVDTVGAGDAFTSVMITGIIKKWPLATTIKRAQQLASKIVGQRGATVFDPSFYQPFIQQWSLNSN